MYKPILREEENGESLSFPLQVGLCFAYQLVLETGCIVPTHGNSQL